MTKKPADERTRPPTTQAVPPAWDVLWRGWLLADLADVADVADLADVADVADLADVADVADLADLADPGVESEGAR